MRKITIQFYFLLTFLTLSVFCSAQSKTIVNSYVINNNTDESKLSFYKKSIEAADFEQYRLRDKTVSLNFKNGFQLELLSAKELVIKGIAVNPNAYTEGGTNKLTYPTFNITASGQIMAEVKTSNPKEDMMNELRTK